MRLLIDVFETNEGRREIFLGKEFSCSMEIWEIITKKEFLPTGKNLDIQYLLSDFEICIIKCDDKIDFDKIKKKCQNLFQAI